MINIYHFGGLK